MGASLASVAPDADARGFRDTLSQFATGVTIVTTAGPSGPIGITANSFASVSLDPPLVLWSPAKSSQRFSHFSNARAFAIHVLAAHQHEVCAGFARDWAAFDDLTLGQNAEGVPIFDACLARYECSLETAHDAGDHMIIVGRVLRAGHREGRPLVFHAGQYGDFNTLP